MISDTPIDSILALVDDWGLLDSYPGIATAGEYDFAGTKMDLGQRARLRLYAGITSSAFIADDLIDNYTNNVDDWGLIDGTAVEDAEVKLQVRTTNDDPNGAPTWGSWHDAGPHRRLPGARLRLPPALHERPDHAQPRGERSQRHGQRLGTRKSRCLH
jgi:hypothetical protein